MLTSRPRNGMSLPMAEVDEWPAAPPLPGLLRLPLRHSRFDQSEPLVRAGQRVGAGEALSRPSGLLARAVHAPLEGTVSRVAVLPVVHPPLRDGTPGGVRPSPCVELVDLSPPAPAQSGLWREWQKPELLAALKPWGLGGPAGLPLDLELALLPGEARLLVLAVGPAQALLDAQLARFPDELAAAVVALARVHPFREVLLVAAPGAAQPLKRLEKTLSSVLPVKGTLSGQGHPWDQPRLAALAAGRPLPAAGLPLAAQGLLAVGLDQLLALESRLSGGLPLGPLCVQLDELREAHGLPRPARSRLLRVWPGTPLEQILPTGDAEGWLVNGSPLEGSPWLEAGAPVLPGHGLLSRLPAPPRLLVEEACIHCGLCLDICPMRLAPIRLVRLAGEGRLAEARRLGVEECVHCGLCSWTCPSRVELEDGLRMARHRLARSRHAG